MSALAFGPEGVLFVGDGKGGSVFAIDLGARTPQAVKDPKEITDVEGRLAALLGAAPADVMVHDLAVDPIAKRRLPRRLARPRRLEHAVAAAQRRRRRDACWCASTPRASPRSWTSSSVRHARVALPNPIDAAKTVPWKKTSLRADTITDMAYADGTLYVAGLSNEEFASTMWKVAYPFAGAVSATTIENYHGAHGKYETEAPVRTFVPYPLKGKTHLLAAYLCTPLVTFPASDLKDKQHVRGRTVGEFGSGQLPAGHGRW